METEISSRFNSASNRIHGLRILDGFGQSLLPDPDVLLLNIATDESTPEFVGGDAIGKASTKGVANHLTWIGEDFNKITGNIKRLLPGFSESRTS